MDKVIEVPYKFHDAWGREQVQVLRYARDVDPQTRHVRWTLLPGREPTVPGSLPPLRVVALGGGTGLPVVLRALRRYAASARNGEPRVELTAVVTVADDGGSSGEVSRQLGVLPPGDVRNCLLALSPEKAPLSAVLAHRFESAGGLRGHSLGNLFLAAFSQMRGDFAEAVALTGELLGAEGRVLPCTQDPVELVAEFEDGAVVAGESRIPVRRGRIRRVRLAPPAIRPSPSVVAALAAADLIVVGPGSLYTSLIPVLLVPEVAEAIRGASAVRVLVANLMTQPGETDEYDVADHLTALEAHAGPGLFQYVLVNSVPPQEDVRARYAAEGAAPVVLDRTRIGPGGPACLADQLAADGAPARHDPERLARALLGAAGVRPEHRGAGSWLETS